MQDIDSATQVIGRGGYGSGFGGDGMGGNPLLWLITLGFMRGGRGGLGGGFGDDGFAGGGGGHHNDVHHFERLAENTGKVEALQAGQSALSHQLTKQDTDRNFDNLSGKLTELAGISRDINDTVFRESAAFQRSLAECCCDLREGQSDIKTAIALQTNDLITNANGNTQRLLDKLCDNQIQSLQIDNANLRSELSTNKILAECDSRRH